TRLPVRKHPLRHALADDRHRLAVFAIELVEIASGDHRHAERGENSGRNDAELAARIVFRRPANVTFSGELHAGAERAPFPPWRKSAQSDAVYTRQLVYAPDRFFVEIHDLALRPPI